MDKKELKQLSKSQLIEIILSLKENIRQLEQIVRAFDNPHTPAQKSTLKKIHLMRNKIDFPENQKEATVAVSICRLQTKRRK